LGAGLGRGRGLPLGVGLASGLGLGLASGLGEGVWVAAGLLTSVPVAVGVAVVVWPFATFPPEVKPHCWAAPSTDVSVSLLPLLRTRSEITGDDAPVTCIAAAV